MQLYRPVVNESKIKGEFLTLGDSREPPVATFFGRMKRWNGYREVVWCKRQSGSPLWGLSSYRKMLQLSFHFRVRL
jgi:hypothetical protein